MTTYLPTGNHEEPILFNARLDDAFFGRVCTVADEMAEERCKGLHKVRVQDRYGNVPEAVVELRYRRVLLLPPRAKQSRYAPIKVTILQATERGKPKGRDPIEWKLVTDLPITSRASAIEKLRWYALRWKIETFHKILTSGCHAEQSKLRTTERLVNLMAMFCILSWRIFWMTMITRVAANAKPEIAFTLLEINLLNRLTQRRPAKKPTTQLGDCLIQLATSAVTLHVPAMGRRETWLSGAG